MGHRLAATAAAVAEKMAGLPGDGLKPSTYLAKLQSPSTNSKDLRVRRMGWFALPVNTASTTRCGSCALLDSRGRTWVLCTAWQTRHLPACLWLVQTAQALGTRSLFLLGQLCRHAADFIDDAAEAGHSKLTLRHCMAIMLAYFRSANGEPRPAHPVHICSC